VYHAVVVFNGTALELWLDGKLQQSKPSIGTRSTEGFFIGGNARGDAAASQVDGMPSQGYFTGQIARLTLYGMSLDAKTVGALHQAAATLPFFRTGK
jgi:hypothetical protein